MVFEKKNFKRVGGVSLKILQNRNLGENGSVALPLLCTAPVVVAVKLYNIAYSYNVALL